MCWKAGHPSFPPALKRSTNKLSNPHVSGDPSAHIQQYLFNLGSVSLQNWLVFVCGLEKVFVNYSQIATSIDTNFSPYIQGSLLLWFVTTEVNPQTRIHINRKSSSCREVSLTFMLSRQGRAVQRGWITESSQDSSVSLYPLQREFKTHLSTKLPLFALSPSITSASTFFCLVGKQLSPPLMFNSVLFLIK